MAHDNCANEIVPVDSLTVRCMFQRYTDGVPSGVFMDGQDGVQFGSQGESGGGTQ